MNTWYHPELGDIVTTDEEEETINRLLFTGECKTRAEAYLKIKEGGNLEKWI